MPDWILWFLLILAILVGFLLLIPSMKWLRRMNGYMLLADLVASTYVISAYASTGTFAGLALAVLAAVSISLALRALRALFGAERLSVGGDSRVIAVIAEIGSFIAGFLREFVTSLVRGTKMDPAAFNPTIEWTPVHKGALS